METIKFTNEYGEEVDESQKDVLEYFFKKDFVDGKPVKRENYKNGNFSDNTYYVSSLEEIEARLKEEPSVSFNYRYIQNGFTIKELLEFNDGILIFKTVIVIDNKNRICYANYESEDGELKLTRIEKSFYKDDELFYNFDYNKDGSCFFVSDEQKYQSDIFGWSIEDTFWEGLEYYKTAEPIIPKK